MGRLVGAAVRVAPWTWSLVLAVVMLGGALGGGFVLTYDMVWVPDLAVRSDFWGLASSLPRAVPSDLLVALADEVVPGMVLQKIVLLLTLVLAGVGAWRLVPSSGWVAPAAATSFYVWSPFVAERLGIGHWPLLMTYAALPWILRAAGQWTAGEPAFPRLVLWLAFGSLSPAGGVIAAVAAISGVLMPRRGRTRRVVWTGAAAAALNAPWIVAGALHGSNALSDASGVTVFAAHPEGALPVPLALLGLGGIWNAEVVPVSRTLWPGIAMLVLVITLCAVGVRDWRTRTTIETRVPLLIVGVVGLGVALAGATAPGALAWLVVHIPGAGLIRDGSRFVALLAPLEATLFGLGVARVAGALPVRKAGVAVAVGLILAPVSLMPDAALGLSQRLEAVDYPAEYEEARRALKRRLELGHEGDLLVLPFTSYRRPTFNDGRRTLDPIGRYLPANYLANDTLVVSGTTIPGEDARADRVAQLLATTQGPALLRELRREGIGWVILDHEAALDLQATSAPETPSTFQGAEVLHRGDALTLWEVPTDGGVEPEGEGAVVVILMSLAWGFAALAAAMAVVGAVVVRSRAGSAQMRRGP